MNFSRQVDLDLARTAVQKARNVRQRLEGRKPGPNVNVVSNTLLRERFFLHLREAARYRRSAQAVTF